MKLVAITDERSALARKALRLISESIWDVHPTGMLLAELEETRLGQAEGGGYHLVAAVDEGEPVGAAAGAYLAAVNAGFVAYLAVDEERRGAGVGAQVRARLLQAFREEAGRELDNVVGEVERDSRWLKRLVREGRAMALDVPYFHPWMSRRREGYYVLYREPLADRRATLPAAEVARLLEAIWRRAYHIDEPEERDTWRAMMRSLQGRAEVGADPSYSP